MLQNTKYKKLLKKQKLNQLMVVSGTSLTASQVSNIANNSSNFTMRMIKILCKFHQCSPNHIIDWEAWLDPPDQKPARKK